ncbi:FMN-binding negative transcriptional regulator [Pseudochryseolinea flava]|uniref:FMN-binding negative transcriptional regulator n=1 Tax=Pseudochryseolinea flava TaxID=2059302 RepID=A0A364XYL1_9BACT|nr:FMN-binding negative transcriptional regulator [Pseudochryseolinea flava]RAV99427.1 FMN-binding negative transcriptional regulator [Pseudochryseolinea flava]
MYTPNHFKQPDEAVTKSFIRENGFGTLISQVEGSLWASHIPMQLSADGSILSGHVSRGNKSWKSFENANEVLAIFQGPHTYISSSWYDHQNVPTWNYIAVHVYGSIRTIEGEELYQSLKDLLDTYEAHVEHPVTMESLSDEYVNQNLRALVGFQIEISRMEASYKLSQNRDAKNHQSIIKHLEQSNDANAHAIANEMKKHHPKN